MTTEIAKVQSAAVMEEQTVDEVMAQVQKIQALMKSAMKEGEQLRDNPRDGKGHSL